MTPPDWTRPIVRVIGVSLMAMGWVVCLSHMVGRVNFLRIPGRPTDPGMAFNTAVCFGLTGTALYLMTRKEP